MVDPRNDPFHRPSSNRLTVFIVRFKKGGIMFQAAFTSIIGPDFIEHYVYRSLRLGPKESIEPAP